MRRPQTLAELMAVTGSDEPTLREIVDRFRAEGVSFLTPYGDAPIGPDTLIDISHEALIRCWHKIADEKEGWLQREFQDRLIWQSLRIQAGKFAENKEQVLSPAATEYQRSLAEDAAEQVLDRALRWQLGGRERANDREP